ncbi:hypothetical protein [Mesorhizobium sp. WSM3862]|nr:hypothetical protein [Mesorhizobium sp. WSM3862]
MSALDSPCATALRLCAERARSAQRPLASACFKKADLNQPQPF